MDLGFHFDASQVEPNRPYEPLPAGEYRVQIVESNYRENESTGSKYVELVMEVLDGEFTGRKHFERLSLWHDNATVVDIAQRTLSAICRAVGVMQISNTQPLEFKPLGMKARVTKRKDNGEWQNQMSYIPEAELGKTRGPGQGPADGTARSTQNGGSSASRPGPTQTPVARPTPAANQAPPWKRSA
jgi:hypothetical protein